MITFSIKEASVIGNFKDVPKQAQLILFLSNSVKITPKVVIDKITMVAIKAKFNSQRNKNIKPKRVSIKG